MPPKKRQQQGSAFRQSVRIFAQQPASVFDEAARKRRIQRQLETLEKDNFQEDPHANLTWNKAAPKFDDELVFGGDKGKKRRRRKGSPLTKLSGAEQATKKGKKIVAALTKTRFRKSFMQLLEESEKKREDELQKSKKDPSPSLFIPSYSDVAAQPSRFPARKFCAVCGLSSRYVCVRCGAKYCSIPCRDTHVDTRCLKWTV